MPWCRSFTAASASSTVCRSRGSTMEFFHKVTRFPFMHTRKVWYGLSAFLIVASLALVAIRGLNLGVDFTGGVVVETNFPQAPSIEQLRTALAKSGVDG